MIRDAVMEDIPAILEMGKRFAEEAGVIDQVGWDDADVSEMIEDLITNDEHIMLVGERGMIGGITFPHNFNRKTRVFQEVLWRSEGREGLRLLKEAERRAKALGASRVVMLTTAGMKPEATGRLYERLGYEAGEMIYSKAI